MHLLNSTTALTKNLTTYSRAFLAKTKVRKIRMIRVRAMKVHRNKRSRRIMVTVSAKEEIKENK